MRKALRSYKEKKAKYLQIFVYFVDLQIGKNRLDYCNGSAAIRTPDVFENGAGETVAMIRYKKYGAYTAHEGGYKHGS